MDVNVLSFLANGLPILPLLQGTGQPLSSSYFITQTTHLAKSNKEIKFLKVSFVSDNLRELFFGQTVIMKQTLNNQLSQYCVNASYLYQGGWTPCGLGKRKSKKAWPPTWNVSGTCVDHIQTSSTWLHAADAGQSKTNVSSAQADCRLLQRRDLCSVVLLTLTAEGRLQAIERWKQVYT